MKVISSTVLAEDSQGKETFLSFQSCGEISRAETSPLYLHGIAVIREYKHKKMKHNTVHFMKGMK